MPTIGTLTAFGMSDIGHVRKNNEDVFIVLPEYGFCAIADGMGGHNGGEIAAHETISHLSQSITSYLDSHTLSCEETMQFIQKSIIECNQYVHNLSKHNSSLAGMGTTICIALFFDSQLLYAHVGDSRLYCHRNEFLLPMTNDHSLVNKVAKEQRIPVEAARASVKKGVITRSIGTHKNVIPELDLLSIEPGDIFLLCSDGLTDLVSDLEIENILNQNLSLEESTQKLITLAKSHGGRDNITVILANHT